MSGSIVSLQHVEKWYGNNHVVKDMNLEIAEGEFLTLLGPSGCGKTTTLRMIAGFEDATEGIIMVQGERVEDKEPFQRDVNTVFQNYSLFPHMSVYDNVAYGPTIKKVPKSEIRQRVTEMLDMVQMSGYEKSNVRPGVDELRIQLKYHEGTAVITEIYRVSTPGRRVYSSVKDLPRVYNGLGISIVSTPQGVMSDNEARKANVGGEILCQVF